MKYAGVIVLALILSVTFIAGCGIGGSDAVKQTGILKDVDFERLYTVGDVAYSGEGGDKVWLFGQYLDSDVDLSEVQSIGLFDGEYYVEVVLTELENLKSVSEGDYLLVEGRNDADSFNTFIASNLEVIDEDVYEELSVYCYPAVEIQILDEELTVNHGSENLSVQVRIKNTGKLPIDYIKTGSKGTEYVFKTLVNGKINFMYPDSDWDDPESVPVGYMYGLRNFGVLKPGEEATVRLGLGGIVESNEHGTSGLTNIFCSGNVEGKSNEATLQVKFGSVRHRDWGWVSTEYNFANVYSSNEIDVTILSFESSLASDSLPCPLED